MGSEQRPAVRVAREHVMSGGRGPHLVSGARLEDDPRGRRSSERDVPFDAEEAPQRSNDPSGDRDRTSPTLVAVEEGGWEDEGGAPGNAPKNADGHSESLMGDSREEHENRQPNEIHNSEPQEPESAPEILQFEIPRRMRVVKGRRGGRNRHRRKYD